MAFNGGLQSKIHLNPSRRRASSKTRRLVHVVVSSGINRSKQRATAPLLHAVPRAAALSPASSLLARRALLLLSLLLPRRRASSPRRWFADACTAVAQLLRVACVDVHPHRRRDPTWSCCYAGADRSIVRAIHRRGRSLAVRLRCVSSPSHRLRRLMAHPIRPHIR
ncbi:hypothetical protein Scep_026653 [Stephania cephalantha]|uniref:Uncharacterized protein n=1 Tax=Stephania cephalantha TaxID=152367 RepID=A0AAP0EUF7_9MAGN